MVASGLVVDLLIRKIDEYFSLSSFSYVLVQWSACNAYPLNTLGGTKMIGNPPTNMCTLTCQTYSIVNLTPQSF